MARDEPRPLRPIDAVTASVDQLDMHVRALDAQVAVLLGAIVCLAAITAFALIVAYRGARA